MKTCSQWFWKFTKLKIVLAEVPDIALPGAHTNSSDCDDTFTSCCTHARGGFGNLRKLKTVLAAVSCVALHSDLDEILHIWPSKQEINHSRGARCCTLPTGAHIFHPIAMKLSQVENMLAMILEI